MRTRHFILTCCGLLLSLAFLVFYGCDKDDSDPNTNPHTCTLSGRATLATNGAPVTGVQVKLWTGIPPVQYADHLTNNNGEYSFASVPFGDYTITFHSQMYDSISASLTLNTTGYIYNVSLIEKFPQILEAHGSVDTPGGVTHYTFYDVRVYDAVGISVVRAHLGDMNGVNTVAIDLTDGDSDGDLEGEHWNNEGAAYTYSFGIRATDTDGNMDEEFYTFE